MSWTWRIVGGALIACSVFAMMPTVFAEQAVDVDQQAGDLKDQVQRKKDRVKELQSMMEVYRKRIATQETAQVSLENEVGLLDNRIRETEIAVESTQTEIDALTLEVRSLEQQIAAGAARIERQKQLMAELIRRIRQGDNVTAFDVLLARPSLSSFFDRAEEVKRLEKDVQKTLSMVKDLKKSLEEKKMERDGRLADMKAQDRQLKRQQMQLEAERNMKVSLVEATKQSQEEFSTVLYELNQQEQITENDVIALEQKLKVSLDRADDALARGDVLLEWPVTPERGVSAHFHDRSYPFRHLFEHPGTDIPTNVGTPVRAAAGGYVAWTRTGKAYGNYMMVVHPGGIATVYAHLTKFIAKPDSYVERGQIIGLSGGRPGDQGAGLSTGPHLHFEVRQNGIPVNAENFLPSLRDDEE